MTKAVDTAIKLDFPVQLADRLLSEITMRRPTMGDMLDHPVEGERDFRGEIALIAALCNLTPDDVRLLDAADYLKLQRRFLSFRSDSDAA